MLTPAARRLRRAIFIHQELQGIQARLRDLTADIAQEVATAKAAVEDEERREQATRAAQRHGVPSA